MTHLEQIDQYVEGVLSGDIPAGRLQRLAVERHLWDIETQAERNIVWEPQRAERGCAFFPLVLRHTKGEWSGKPFELSLSQTFVVGSVWGWRRRDNGYRRFTRAYCEVGRKWGKSELGAGVALEMGVYDDPPEPGAWINLCATKEDQVRDTTYGQAVKMVRASPWLKAKINIRVKRLLIHDTDDYQPGSVITPIGSDSNTSDGFDTSGAVLDELHAWRKHHHEHYEKMTTAGGSRRQELVWFFTTAGDDKSDLWIQLREQFVRVAESVETKQVVADHVFAFIACIDEADDPLACDLNDSDGFAEFESIMRKSNPNYPITPKPHYLKERAQEAQGNAIEANKFMRFHANVQVSSGVKPFPSAQWAEFEENATPECENHTFGGIDLGRSDDFAAWAVVWKDEENIRCITRSYTPADRPEHLRTAQIANWVKSGHLVQHPGSQVDFQAVEDDIAEAHAIYGVSSWAFDEHYAKVTAQSVARRLGEDVPVKFVQSPRYYNEPCRSFLKAFNAGQVRPEISPCLRWQANNVTFSPNSRDEWMPDKGIGHEYKIDAMVAMLMGYGLMILTPPKPVSIYARRGTILTG
jgi:phage terminase large subunit-like protein